MAYYNICPKCGAHNDPGERCSCAEKPGKQLMILDEHKYIDHKGIVRKNAESPRNGGGKARIYKFNF